MDLPVLEFIQTRLAEADISLETRKNTAYFDLFIKPQELMLQPILTSLEDLRIGQSVRQIINLDDPDAFDEEAVDDLASNLFVARSLGALARTTVRVFYDIAVDREFPALSAEFQTGSGLSFFNENDFSITADEMALNVDGDLFFADIPVVAQSEGDDFNVEPEDISIFVNDADALSVTNTSAGVSGLPRETNSELLNRTRNSIGVRDFETIKGINAIINEKFPGVFKEIQAIGMGDPEMMRDILFNTHVGGHTDVYLKTPALQTKTFDVLGVVFDETREVSRITNKQLTALDFTDPTSELGTPFIVTNSVVVKEDIVETAATVTSASVPAVTGINLAGKEFIKLTIDGGSALNIKISGAVPASTQRFEIINSINAAIGLNIAASTGVDKIRLTSPSVGATSELKFEVPDLPRTDGTLELFPVLGVVPATVSGIAATVYTETVDYEVDHTNGKIKKLAGSAILSGDTVVGPNTDGVITTGSDTFTTPTVGEFALVEPGDELIITASTGITPATYIVKEKVDNENVKLLDFSPTSPDSAVEYSIKSSQVVVISYKFNPLSVDIGPQVILNEDEDRGIRPGRENFTIQDVPFIDIIRIDEIDSDTLEVISEEPLTPAGGYGFGGYGEGGYGEGAGGDFQFVVNSPPERYSVFEDSMIIFEPPQFGKSFRITFRAAPEVEDVHNLSRNDLERVTGADVLPKNFVPGFVDIDIEVKRDPTNTETPDNDALAELVKEFIDSVPASSGSGLEASDIDGVLRDQGIDAVKLPFTMTLTVLNTDGSTTIVTDQNILKLEEPDLPKETDNFVTPRITHFYARNITVTEFE